MLDLMYDLDDVGPGGTVFSGTAIVGAGIEFVVPIQSDGLFDEGMLFFDLDSQSITFSQANSHR